MLREIQCVQQDCDYCGTRLWFADDDMELFVWRSLREDIDAFQLYYDVANEEKVLSWEKLTGCAHYKVDSGDENPSVSRTPILLAGGVFPKERVRAEFFAKASHIDPKTVAFVLGILDKYTADICS